MAKRILWLLFAIIGTSAFGQSVRHYDITIRNLHTAEQQLLYEQKRTIGLHRYEIDRQLREVRQQRMEIERLRAEARRRPDRCATSHVRHTTVRPPPTVYRPPEPDWKTIETPQVMLKGTMMVDGRMAALVSGGQIVHSNQVFATPYQGETRYWRVTEITDVGADFERVSETGGPYVPPRPPPTPDLPEPDPEPPSPPNLWLARLLQAFLGRPY